MQVAVLWRCMWGQVPEGTVPLVQLSARFQSVPLLPTSKVGPSGADFQVSGFVYILEPCESLQRTLLWGWEFLTGFFTQKFWGFISPYWNPGLLSLPCSPVVPPSLSARECGPPLRQPPLCHESSLPGCLAACLRPSYWSVWLFLLYLLGCRTSIVRFSVLLVFLFLNLWLSLVWMCEEAQCIYLCPHLGWKSPVCWLFTLLIFSFAVQKLFVSCSPTCLCFSFISAVWGHISETILLQEMCEILLSMLSFGIFMVLTVPFSI